MIWYLDDSIHRETMPKVVPDYREKARDSILNAAAAEFSEKGYRKTTMDDIARRIGVSKGALYLYFDSKEVLLVSLGEQLVSTISSEIEALFREGAQLEKISKDAFDSLYRMVLSWYPNLLLDMVYEAPNSVKIRTMMKKYTDEIAAKLIAFLEERKRAGEIRSDVDTSAIAYGFITLQRGYMIYLSLGASKSQVKQSWDETTRAILAGMR